MKGKAAKFYHLTPFYYETIERFKKILLHEDSNPVEQFIHKTFEALKREHRGYHQDSLITMEELGALENSIVDGIRRSLINGGAKETLIGDNRDE